MAKKEKRHRGPDPSKTRHKIMAAAKKLFVKQGLNGTSMRQIAEKAKVTQSLLHHHFGNKAALWQKVKIELTNQYFGEIEKRTQSKRPEDQGFNLQMGLEHRFRFLQKNPDLIKMSLWQFLDKYDSYSTEKGRYLIKRLFQNFENAQKEKQIRDDIDPTYITAIIFIMTSGWFQQNYNWFVEQGKSPPKNRQEADDRYLEAIQKILARGLAVDE